jgi:hypothetical protein
MSFDKHVSSLDELLDMSAPYFSKVKFESRINPKIEQHIKVIRFRTNTHIDMEL